VSEVQSGDDATDQDRAVIIAGDMAIVVADVADAAGRVAGIVAASDGRIDGREESGDAGSAAATLILRIPVDALDGAIDELRELGDVGYLHTSTTDVTTEVQDVDAHVTALQSTIARLQTFQTSADTVADLLAIESEIADRRAELEGYLTQQAGYAEQVALSKLALTLSSQPVPSDAPDSFWSGVVVGWNALMAFLGGLVIVVGVLLPWLVGLAVVAALIVLLVRALRRRTRKPPRQDDPPAAPPVLEPVGVAPAPSVLPPR